MEIATHTKTKIYL